MGGAQTWRCQRKRNRPSLVNKGSFEAPMVSYLSSTVTRDGVASIVPQALVRARDRLLIMIAMRKSNSYAASNKKQIEQHSESLLSIVKLG